MRQQIQSRLHEFRTEIRRTHIEKTRNVFRRVAELDLTTICEIASMLGLPPKQEPNKYTFEELLLQRKHSLERPPFGFMAEEYQEAIMLPIQTHIRFWKLYSECLNSEDNASIDLKTAIEVLLEIVKNYQYSLIHYNTTYELHFLNTLELVCLKMNRKGKDIILDWIRGSEGLRVIDSCIQNDHFLGYNEYRYVYQVIEVGLKSEFKSDNIQAAKLISKILKYADWDDTFKLYQNVHGIMIYLCKKIEKYCKDEETFIFNLALMHLLDTYDQAIFAYARTGAGYTAALLITSTVESNRSEGLEILRIISNVSKVDIVVFLLENKDILYTGLWERFFESEDFFRCKNIEIRKNYYTILDSLLAHGENEMIQNICGRYSNHFKDIFEVFAETLEHEDEDYIIERVLNSMKSIIYYGNQSKSMDYIIQSCQQKGLDRTMERLMKRSNRLVVESAYEILQVISQNRIEDNEV